MRFFNLVTVLFTIIPICSPQVLQPEDVGIGHTKIIQDLHQLMKDKPPADRDEYFSHMVETVADNLCEPFVSFECFQRIWDSTDEIDTKFIDGFDHLSKNIVPDDFDGEVLESMKKLFFSLSLTSLNESPEYVLQLMYEDFMDLKNNEKTMNEEDRMIGLVAYSVGMESTKQWHEILNDPENQFSKLINAQKEINRRQLQEGDGIQATDILANIEGASNLDIDFVFLIEADVIGASAGAISGGFDLVQGNNNTILEQSLESASLYSATNIINQFTPESSNGGFISGVVDTVTGGNNGTGFINNVIGAVTGNNNNTEGNGGGIVSNVIGAVTGNNNNNTEGEGGGFFSNVIGAVTGNNNNNTEGGGGGGGGFFSNVIGAVTGNNNNNNNNNDGSTGGESDAPTGGEGNVFADSPEPSAVDNGATETSAPDTSAPDTSAPDTSATDTNAVENGATNTSTVDTNGVNNSVNATGDNDSGGFLSNVVNTVNTIAANNNQNGTGTGVSLLNNFLGNR